MELTIEERILFGYLRERQKIWLNLVKHGYGMGDYVRLSCPWCNGQSEECGKDPRDFHRQRAFDTFKHDDDCKLEDVRTLLNKMDPAFHLECGCLGEEPDEVCQAHGNFN